MDRLKKPLRLAALAAAWAVLGSGCADACFQIQQTLCQCRGRTETEITSCETTETAQESLQPPTSQQVTACAALLPGCQKAINNGNSCQALETIDGRQACGIAAKN